MPLRRIHVRTKISLTHLSSSSSEIGLVFGATSLYGSLIRVSRGTPVCCPSSEVSTQERLLSAGYSKRRAKCELHAVEARDASQV